MTNRTINQPAPTLQEKMKTLQRRISHLSLLIDQVRSEVTEMSGDISIELNNHMQQIALQLDNAKQDLAYLINKQEDIEHQQQSEPLIIKAEDNETKT
jgi:hypothetical protein